VLLVGLSGVALLFSYGVRTNLHNTQRTTAAAVLARKLEELRMDKSLMPGDYIEFAAVEGSAVRYRVVWRISTSTPLVTVVVYDGPFELARGTLRKPAAAP
jgi:hypothetical protein